MRKVKYQDTGEYGNNLEGYRGTDNKWYCSKDAYDRIILIKQQKRNCINKMGEILDVGENGFVPPVYVKMFGKFAKVGFDVLYEVLCEQEDSIKWAFRNKKFTNDYHAAKYLDAILCNNYRQVKERIDTQKRMQAMQHDPEIEQDEVEFNRANKNKDISNLVGDFIWT